MLKNQKKMADSVVSKLCWFNSKVLNNPQRPFCQESALFGQFSLSFSSYLCQRPCGAVLSGNPHHCALALPLTHTYTHLGLSCAPLWRNHMCELKGLMQKLINPRKKLSLDSLPLYSISIVVMSSIALLNAKHTLVWMTNLKLARILPNTENELSCFLTEFLRIVSLLILSYSLSTEMLLILGWGTCESHAFPTIFSGAKSWHNWPLLHWGGRLCSTDVTVCNPTLSFVFSYS